MTAGLLCSHLLQQSDNLRTEIYRNKTMAGDYRHTQIPHCDENNNKKLHCFSRTFSPLTMVQFQDRIWFIRLCCFCHTPKEELLVLHFRTRKCCWMSPYTDLLPEFDVRRKCVRNSKLTATNSSTVSSWSSSVTQTTAVLILQFNVEKRSCTLNIKINSNYI
jgi:hypothetical protein